MDDYVRELLTGLGLENYIKKFKDEGIDEESLLYLSDGQIQRLFGKIGPEAKFKKALQALKDSNGPNQVSDKKNTSDIGKRKSKGVPSYAPKPKRQRETSNSEISIRSDVKKIMTSVQKKIPQGDDTELIKFLKKKITNLRTEKRELVGVFGKTGAGKSSLINAVIGEKDLLPSGDISACTTVMIKVEANTKNQNYEAEIEFITKEDWEHDLWFQKTFILNDTDNEKDDTDHVEGADDYNDAVEMLAALYGKDWEKIISQENIWEDKRNREVHDYINGKKLSLACTSAGELSEKLVKFTRRILNDEDGKDKKCFWPLVKCVTVKVPNNDLLQHVTLVDLPGSGDRNKSRDKMWKEVVGDCSTVWVVTEINRAASEKEPWDILESASGLIGNGGQCQRIYFICTKSDIIANAKKRSASEICTAILKRNIQAKQEVKREYKKLKKAPIGEDCFEVFTVSSTEYLEQDLLKAEDTEIPNLQEFLQNINNQHSEMLTYQFVSEAKGILSVIQGARSGGAVATKAGINGVLKQNIKCEHEKVLESMQKTLETFENCLSEGVENSKSSCDQAVKYFLHPIGVKGGAFHQTLRCIVANNGAYKPKNKKKLNLNAKLSSLLAERIDEEFKKTFPNESQREPFNGAIASFSLDIKTLIEEHKDVQLQLEYLGSVEEKMMADLQEKIRTRKKHVYNSLTITIQETMQPCYDKAQNCKGKGYLDRVRKIIKQHVLGNKDEMFEKAKNEMLSQLRDLMEDIPSTMLETMQESLKLALGDADQSLPDVSKELKAVTEYYDQLKKSTDAETSAVWNDLPGPSNAQNSLVDISALKRDSRGLICS